MGTTKLPMFLPLTYILLSLLFASPTPPVSMETTQLPGGLSTYTLSGSAQRDDTNQPLPGVRVQLLTAAGNVAHPAILTDTSGEFSFGQFTPGEYVIVAELDGYQSARLSVQVSRFNQSNLIVRLRKQPTTADPAGDAIAAHELAVPQKARSAFDKGLAKADSQKDYQGAVQEFQRAIKAYPEYYEAYSELGLAYVRLKEFPAAEKALRTSIEMSAQTYPPPLTLLSMLLNDQNRPSEAEPLAHRVIAADPSAWRGPYELSRAMLGLRRLPEAEASAYVARDLKPDNPDVYLLLSEIHRHTQNAPALLQDIDAYLKLAPQGPAAPQVRQLREQLLKFMQAQSKPNATHPPKP